MPKTFNSIWVHIVFRTKNNIPFLTWQIRNEICQYIKSVGNRKGYAIDTVNGVKDHLHVLLRIKTTQTVAESVQWIKGASSKYLNDKYNWYDSFAWQEGYGVFSVSLHDISTVRNYIYNQEKHHKKDNLISKYEKTSY